MAVLSLTRNEKIKGKLEEEINEIIKKDEDITTENMNKMGYLKAVIKETIRMYTPAIGLLVREVTEDHEIAGVKVSKGTLITVEFMPSNFNP